MLKDLFFDSKEKKLRYDNRHNQTKRLCCPGGERGCICKGTNNVDEKSTK